METMELRCFASACPDLPLNVNFAIVIFIPLRTYPGQSDLTHWLFTLLEHGSRGKVCNVGSD